MHTRTLLPLPTALLFTAPLLGLPLVELEPVDTTAPAPAAPSLTVPDLDAARAELARVPGGAGIIDSDAYLRGRASTLADTFALAPGVFAQPRFGADEARLSIRGSGLQRTFHGRGIRVLQDGVPLNLADGGFDMQSLEPAAAAYVTVHRGANALARGGSTLGGAIDYVSRTGRSDPGALARLELGSFDYLRATLGGGLTCGATDAYASFTQAQQDGFREHAAQNTQRLFTNAGLRFNERVETRLFLTAVRTDSELPGNLTKAQLEADPRQANPANLALDQKRDFDLLRAASKTTATLGADSSVSLLAAWTYKDLDHPIFQVIDHLSNDALLGLAFAHEGELLGRDHHLRAGLLYHRGETRSAQFNNDAGARGLLRQRDEQVAANLEAYAESQFALGAGFTGILGLSASENTRRNTRLFTANAAGTQITNPDGSTYDRRFDHLAPKIGARWDNAARDLQFYANVSGSYEPPSFSEGGTTGATVVANRAQEAITYELGTRGARGPLRWDLSLYHARLDDELLAIQLPGPVTGTLNADRTIHQGVELGLEADLLGTPWKTAPGAAPAQRLVARLAWTYGDFRFDGPVPGVPDSEDNRIAGLPPHLLRGELLLETAAGWYFGPTFEWVPEKSYVDHANTLAADPYALVGLKAGRRLPRGLSFFVEARNLADKTHAATHGVILNAAGADSPQFLPGDGRALYLGGEYRF